MPVPVPVPEPVPVPVPGGTDVDRLLVVHCPELLLEDEGGAVLRTFAEVIAAPPERLREAELTDGSIADFKTVLAAARRLAKETVQRRPIMSSFKDVIDYCRAAMAHSDREEFRVLFLDKKNAIIADEVLSVGTVDHTPVYPREIVKRALELGSTALVLAHNHPSGDPAPSSADIRMTEEIVSVSSMMGIVVHDHLIIGRHGHASFKGLRLL